VNKKCVYIFLIFSLDIHGTNAIFFLILDQLICGFEWNLENQGQIDLTWWMTWYDLGSQNWKSEHSTLVLQQWNDYWDFYNSFNGEGFSVLINLAEGGNFPGTSDALIDGQPQLLVVKSAKVYGF
jgi:hypothetical protein